MILGWTWDWTEHERENETDPGRESETDPEIESTKLPSEPIKKLLGVKRIDDALLTIYNGLQNKRLNKQLVYTLLDVFLGEVLSELKEWVISR